MVERIVDLIKKKGMSINAVEKQLGFGNGAIKRFDTNSPSIDKIISLSNFLNVSLDYLVIGKDNANMLSNEERELIDIFKKLSPINRCRVVERAETLVELQTPAIQDFEEDPEEQETIFIEFATLKASAGTGEQLIDDPERNFIEVVKSDTTLQAKFAIQIHGDSMEPEYTNGDIVLVKAQPQIDIGQIGIFTVNDMGYIKKLGTDRLISVNPEYDDIYFKEGQDIRCKGLVIGTLEDDDFVWQLIRRITNGNT